MKLHVLLILLLLTAPLAPVMSCDMDGEQGQGSGHHTTGQAAMQHDCCDPPEPEQESSCDASVHCGSCSTLVTPVILVNGMTLVLEHGEAPGLLHAATLPSHSSPPFRPPIS